MSKSLPEIDGHDNASGSDSASSLLRHRMPAFSANGTPLAADSPSDRETPIADPLAEFAPIEPPPAAVPDPTGDLDAYISTHQVGANSKAPPRILSMQIRKPHAQEFVRVMPDVERILPLFKCTAAKDKLYLFRPEVAHLLPPKAIRSYRLVLAKSMLAVTPFIWPLPVPRDDFGRTWHESGDKAARAAELQWIKVESDMVGGCYIYSPADEEHPEPPWTTTADLFSGLVLLAFKNQRIDSADHPIIKNLKGKRA